MARRARLLTPVLLIAAATLPCLAASVPAWLDDGITRWNGANPASQLSFIAIKDSYVWYQMPKSTQHTLPELRDRLNQVVLGNGYQPLDDEELVTTGKPPVASGRSYPKKCWSRGFVLNIEAQSGTKAVGDDEAAGQRQRMLTSMVCDDTSTWWAAFRVAN